jgi:hypothetical protein
VVPISESIHTDSKPKALTTDPAEVVSDIDLNKDIKETDKESIVEEVPEEVVNNA